MSLSPVARSSTFTQSLLLAAVGVTALGQTLVFTLLPSLGRATGLAEIQVGLIISCSSLAFALASPVWGYLSELYGRRPILIIGLSGYATGTLLFALVFQAGLAGWVSGGVLVALLVAADRLNVDAANSLLKTLEEPPDRTVFFLVSTEPERLLDTIRSRCLR